MDKWIAKCLRIASDSDGILESKDVPDLKKLGVKQISIIFKYLSRENICYSLDANNTQWLFPNVVHRKTLVLDEWIRSILSSAAQSIGFKVYGPSSLIFTRLVVSISHELGPAIGISNTAAAWSNGKGRNAGVILMEYIPGPNSSVFRFKSGGTNSPLHSVLEIIHSIFSVYVNKVEEI